MICVRLGILACEALDSHSDAPLGYRNDVDRVSCAAAATRDQPGVAAAFPQRAAHLLDRPRPPTVEQKRRSPRRYVAARTCRAAEPNSSCEGTVPYKLEMHQERDELAVEDCATDEEGNRDAPLHESRSAPRCETLVATSGPEASRRPSLPAAAACAAAHEPVFSFQVFVQALYDHLAPNERSAPVPRSSDRALPPRVVPSARMQHRPAPD